MLLLEQIKQQLQDISITEIEFREALFSFNKSEQFVKDLQFNYANKYPIYIIYQNHDITSYCDFNVKQSNEFIVNQEFFRSEYSSIYYNLLSKAQDIYSLYLKLLNDIEIYSYDKSIELNKIMESQNKYQKPKLEDFTSTVLKKKDKSEKFIFKPIYDLDLNILNLANFYIIEEFFNFNKKFFTFETFKIQTTQKEKLFFDMSGKKCLKEFKKFALKKEYFGLRRTNKKHIQETCRSYFLLPDDSEMVHLEFDHIYEMNNF